MDFKTSLLLYRTQTINVNDLWNTKLRLIKSLTPLFRSFKEQDLILIKEFKTGHNALATQANLIVDPLKQAKATSNDQIQKGQIQEQINSIYVQYLEDYFNLSKTLKNDKILELESRTKLLVILYCTWSEAVFKKLKHTPHGLPLVNREQNYGSNLELKWSNLIDTIMNQIIISGNHLDITQMKTELKDISNKYIIEKSKIRNKIAHGQWTQALNTPNTGIVIDTSVNISNLDIVEIDVSFDIHNYMVQILQSILESNDPQDMITTRHDSYLFLKEKLDNFIYNRKEWNTESRITFLKQRKFDTRNLEIASILKSKGISAEIVKSVTGVE